MEPQPFSQLTHFYRLRTTAQVWADAWAFWWQFRGALWRALCPLAAAPLALVLLSMLLGQAGLSPELASAFRLGPYLAAALVLPVGAAVAARHVRAVTPVDEQVPRASAGLPGWGGALVLWLLPLLVAVAPLLVAGPWGVQMLLAEPAFGAMLVLLGLPALWLVVRWSLAVPAALLGRLSAEAALRRSGQLVQGRWWRTAAVVLGGGLVVYLANWCATLIVGVVLALADAVFFDDYDLLSSAEIGTWVAQLLAGVLLVANVLICWPVLALALVFHYLSLLEQTEAVSLRLLSQQLGQPISSESELD